MVAEFGYVTIFGKVVGVQCLLKTDTVKPTQSLEFGGISDIPAHQIVADDNAETAGGKLKGGIVDQPLNDRLDDPQFPGIVDAELVPQNGPEPGDFPAHKVLDFGRTEFHIANFDHRFIR